MWTLSERVQCTDSKKGGGDFHSLWDEIICRYQLNPFFPIVYLRSCFFVIHLSVFACPSVCSLVLWVLRSPTIIVLRSIAYSNSVNSFFTHEVPWDWVCIHFLSLFLRLDGSLYQFSLSIFISLILFALKSISFDI